MYNLQLNDEWKFTVRFQPATSKLRRLLSTTEPATMENVQYKLSWRQSSIKVRSSNNLINTRSRVIGSLSAMLNGQKRKSGEKSAWITLDSLHFPQCCTLSWLTWNHNGGKKACCEQNRILFLFFHGQLQIQVSKHNIMPFISGLMPYLKIHKSDQHKLKCYFANCSAESCASLVHLN